VFAIKAVKAMAMKNFFIELNGKFNIKMWLCLIVAIWCIKVIETLVSFDYSKKLILF